MSAPAVTVHREARSRSVDIEITAATAEQAIEAFNAFCGSPVVVSSQVLRRPHATSDGYVLFGRATLVE
jgi:hypothetical protein